MSEFVTILRESRAFRAMFMRDLDLVKRYLGWEIEFLFYTIISSLTIGLIGSAMAGAGMSHAVVQEKTLYLIIGALLWGFLSVQFEVIADTVAWERWEGTIEFTFMAPIHRTTHLLSSCLFGVLYGILRIIIVMVVLTIFFKLDLSSANFVAAILVLVAGSTSFLGLGLLAAVFPLLSPEKGAQASQIIMAVVLLVSGVYYPVEVLPVWLRWMGTISPATYTLDAMRAALIDGASVRDVAVPLVGLTALGIVLIPVGFKVFDFAERWAKRTGKLKRSG